MKGGNIMGEDYHYLHHYEKGVGLHYKGFCTLIASQMSDNIRSIFVKNLILWLNPLSRARQ